MIARLLHDVWALAARPRAKRFANGLSDPRAAQRTRLHAILDAAGDCGFSNDHRLAGVRSVEAFRERVPVRSWDELHPWRSRTEAGEQGVLTRDPVLRLAPTSGSTAALKLVPTGKALIGEFRAALDPWISDLFRSDPLLAGGCSYWAISPPGAFAREARAGFPIGFGDDTAYFGSLARLAAAVQAVPNGVAAVDDPVEFRDRTLAHLLCRPDLRLVSVWHPSFLELLLDHLALRWEHLLEQVERAIDGSAGSVARRLRRRAERLTMLGPDPKALWPMLRLVSLWSDAGSAAPASALGRRLPGVVLQPKGLVATEGIASIPYEGMHPLAITSHFLEFLDEDGRIREAHELRVGGRYEVVLTTSGGLWRLRTGDLVEVDGRLLATPSIRFLGRVGGVVDLRGEKLHEIHVGECLRALDGLLEPGAWRMLAPSPGGDGYCLWVDRSELDQSALLDLLEMSLSRNPHYALARRLGQLRPPSLFAVAPGARGRLLEVMASEGRNAGAVKVPELVGASEWCRWRGAVVEPVRRGNRTTRDNSIA